MYEGWLLLELCAPELRSDPQSEAVLACGPIARHLSCSICIWYASTSRVGWSCGFACRAPDAKQQTIGVIPNNIENVSNWVKLRVRQGKILH
jgi:hypothetical protein